MPSQMIYGWLHPGSMGESWSYSAGRAMLTAVASRVLDSIVNGTTANDNNSTVVVRPSDACFHGRLVRFAYYDLV